MRRILRLAIGYRVDSRVPRAWRIGCHAAITGTVLLAAIRIFSVTHTTPPRSIDYIRIVARLDDYTREAPDSPNAIPAFLALPGSLGALGRSAAAADVVKSIDEGELQRGLCSTNIARLVRHEYPGFYEHWTDEALQRVVVAKHPEYQERLCVLPTFVGAGPDAIIKYEMKPRSALARHAAPALWAAVLAIAIATALLNLYYRVVVGRFAHRAA